MKCPHCLENFYDSSKAVVFGADKAGDWATVSQTCPACKRIVVDLAVGKRSTANPARLGTTELDFRVFPKGTNRPPCPDSVPVGIQEDYSEACLVLQDSPKASAALSRRALQHVLRDAAGVKKSDLAKEIQEVLDSGKLPTHLADSIDAIRNIGNFSAHPQKSINTGEILPVEPQEADWTLEVLEQLFDFYYEQPTRLRARRDALNAKLAEAGKPAMK